MWPKMSYTQSRWLKFLWFLATSKIYRRKEAPKKPSFKPGREFVNHSPWAKFSLPPVFIMAHELKIVSTLLSD